MHNLTLQIVQTENEVQTTRKFSDAGEDRTISQKFALDGSESTNPASNGQGQLISRSTWRDNRLVNSGTQTSTGRLQNYEMNVNEEYTLSKDGKKLTIKTTRFSRRGEMTLKQVFKKQDSESGSGKLK